MKLIAAPLAVALFSSVLEFFSLSASAAQPVSTVPLEGLRDASSRVHALVGARVVTSPDTVVANGTVVIRDGQIAAVGAGLPAPADARIWDVRGRTIYAGFIESESSLFLPAAWKAPGVSPRDPGADSAPAAP